MFLVLLFDLMLVSKIKWTLTFYQVYSNLMHFMQSINGFKKPIDSGQHFCSVLSLIPLTGDRSSRVSLMKTFRDVQYCWSFSMERLMFFILCLF